jgi:glycosyltransferase involved in cell wall biosynthesis
MSIDQPPAAPRPIVSFVIPWRDRRDLAASLQHNSAVFCAERTELVIACCGGDSDWVVQLLKDYRIPGKVLRIEHFEFNRSLAINIGVYAASGDYVQVIDCDIALDNVLVAELLRLRAEFPLMNIGRLAESAPRDHAAGPEVIQEWVYRLRLPDARCIEIVTSRTGLTTGTRRGSGQTFTSKNVFMSVGGMHSDNRGWGFEENDFEIRIQILLHVTSLEVGSAIHLSHGDEDRYSLRPTIREDELANRWACVQRYLAGDFKGTYGDDHRRVSWTVRQLPECS